MEDGKLSVVMVRMVVIVTDNQLIWALAMFVMELVGIDQMQTQEQIYEQSKGVVSLVMDLKADIGQVNNPQRRVRDDPKRTD